MSRKRTTTGRANIATPDLSTGFSSCPGMSDTIYIQSKSSRSNNHTVFKNYGNHCATSKTMALLWECVTFVSQKYHLTNALGVLKQASCQCSTLHFNSDDRKDVIDILSQQELTLQKLQHKKVHFTNVIVKSNSMCRRNRIHVRFLLQAVTHWERICKTSCQNMKWVGNFCSAGTDCTKILHPPNQG